MRFFSIKNFILSPSKITTSPSIIVTIVFVVVVALLIELNECSSLAELIKENSVFTAKNTNNQINTSNKNELPSNEYDSESLLDSSIFGNTYETFFEFANRRTFEIESRNKDLYEKSMRSCIYTPYENENDERGGGGGADEDDAINENLGADKSSTSQCLVSVLNLAEHHGSSGSGANSGGLGGKTSDRLFQFDAKTLGLISSSDSSLRLFDFNATHGVLQSMRVKYFKSERPYDACADSANGNVYVVFPDENKIGNI
jgi:hypothetical protein